MKKTFFLTTSFTSLCGILSHAQKNHIIFFYLSQYNITELHVKTYAPGALVARTQLKFGNVWKTFFYLGHEPETYAEVLVQRRY